MALALSKDDLCTEVELGFVAATVVIDRDASDEMRDRKERVESFEVEANSCWEDARDGDAPFSLRESDLLRLGFGSFDNCSICS